MNPWRSRIPTLLAWRPQLLPECRVQQVSQPDARALQPIPDQRDVQFQIRRVDDYDLLGRALRKGLVRLLIEALRANPDAILHGLPARDLEGLIGPARD